MRITRTDVANRIAAVNRLQGTVGEYPTVVGQIVAYSAYGQVAVHRVVNTGGGQEAMTYLGTTREAYAFLGGMLAVLEGK